MEFVIDNLGKKRCRPCRGIALLVGIALLISATWAPAPAFAEPPPWAPAHGYRAKFRDIGAGTCQRGLLSPEIVGLLAGAALGGYAGSKIVKGKGKRKSKLAATGAGVFLGALVGSAIGRSMGSADQLCVAKSLESAHDNQAVAWRNPDSDANYRVTPSRSFNDRTTGRYCREYIAEAVIAGEVQQTYGTACRQPDGAWELVN